MKSSSPMLLRRCAGITAYLEINWLTDFSSRSPIKLVPPLEEVLQRLPEEDFQVVFHKVRIFVQHDRALATNYRRRNHTSTDSTIVFFRQCLDVSSKALVGLVAHELAHSFEDAVNEESAEAAANAIARSWGFGDELDCLESELQRYPPAKSNGVSSSG